PEEIARFRALGAEAQNAPPAVDDHRPAAGVPLEGAGVLDGALVRHDVVGAGEPRDVPRQLTHGAMAGDEPEPDCDRGQRRDHRHGHDRGDQGPAARDGRRPPRTHTPAPAPNTIAVTRKSGRKSANGGIGAGSPAAMLFFAAASTVSMMAE